MWSLPALPVPAAGSLLVAFSGGLDSTVLLHRLAHEPAFAGRVRAVHVHHGLQDGADAWAAHCRRLCDAWGIRLDIARVQVDRHRGEGLEAAARAARLAAFAERIADHDVLVTAHHRDDQAETFLLRALRASGVEGLAAMRPWRRFHAGWQWRPLLEIPRAALHAYAMTHALDWIEDPSNTQLEHDRNFLRHQVLPLLRQRWPQADAGFARSAALAGESARLLADEDARALASAATLDPHALRVSSLCALAPERRARVLRRWLHELQLPPLPGEGVRRIEQDLLHARADADAGFRWQHAIVRRWRDLLHAQRRAPPFPEDWMATWNTAAPLELPTGDTLVLESATPWPSLITVGARRGGERLSLPGRTHGHALKKLLQDAGIPPWERERLPLLHDGDGQLLAAGDLLLSGRLEAWLRGHSAALRWRRGSGPAR